MGKISRKAITSLLARTTKLDGVVFSMSVSEMSPGGMWVVKSWCCESNVGVEEAAVDVDGGFHNNEDVEGEEGYGYASAMMQKGHLSGG
jgi:hypothetical protein